VEFRGDAGDLDRFARHVLKHTVTCEELRPIERRMRWDMGGTAGFGWAF
jgi:hypothetical protein